MAKNGRFEFAEGDEQEKKNGREYFATSDVESIYNEYPRKRARARAIRAIRKALARIRSDGRADPVAFLLDRVRLFAASSAGNAGQFVPYCSTWMNDDGFLEDEREWNVSDKPNPTRIMPPPGKYDHLG